MQQHQTIFCFACAWHMSLSTASILLHAFLLLLLLAATFFFFAATTSIPVEVEHGDVNTMTTFTNISAAATSSSSPDSNFEMYFCFLCSGRDPLLIHHCPIYWDECRLICDDDMTTSSTTVDAIPIATTAPPVSPSSTTLGSAAAAAHPMVEEGKDCYVMKLYMSGRYVIVGHLPCKYIAWCFLTCGGGELADDRKLSMGTGTTTTTTMSATIQGSFLPDQELCGTQLQVNAPWAPPSAGGGGVVPVPAGGAH